MGAGCAGEQLRDLAALKGFIAVRRSDSAQVQHFRELLTHSKCHDYTHPLKRFKTEASHFKEEL
jgi:hypothetical protein